MKNTEIFNDYDMVVSMTEKTINDQLTHLTKMGIIRPEFILVQNIVKRQYVYEVLDSADQIPKDSDGNPTVAYIDGAILPQVEISESGTNITFVLKFRSGTACFWEGVGPLAQLTQYDMTGWSYGINVTLDLKAVEKEDINKKISVPKIVEDQLNHFMSNMFSVNHLFMDFESTDLLRFDPTHSNTGSAGDTGLQQLVLFMNFYLTYIQKQGNPFILGYSLTTTDHTVYDADQNVPDLLRPVGTTFTMYHDPVNAALSNLNFVLVTKGGHGKLATGGNFGSVLGTPGNFDSNWLSPQEQCDAKMIYSHSCLVEPSILQPFYEQIRTSVFNKIKDHISVGEGSEYSASQIPSGTGFTYTISNVASGNDQYVNTFTVTFENDATGIAIKFQGHLALYKEVDKNMGFCTATAHASGTIDWSTGLTIAVAKDAKGEPTLQVSKTSPHIDNYTSSSDQNDCAKAFDWIGKILGGILDALTFFADGGYFSNLLDSVFDVPIPGLGDVGVAFGSLGNSVATALLLPAGQVFFFKTPSADAEGNLALQLTYKAED